MDASLVPQHVTTPDNYFLRKLYTAFHKASCTTRGISTADTEAIPREVAAGAFRMNILSTFWDSQCLHLLHLLIHHLDPLHNNEVQRSEGIPISLHSPEHAPVEALRAAACGDHSWGKPTGSTNPAALPAGPFVCVLPPGADLCGYFLILYQCVCCFRPDCSCCVPASSAVLSITADP